MRLQNMKKLLCLLALAGLSACANNQLTPAGAAAVTAATPAVQTLASIAAANSTTVDKLVTEGQLFCAGAGTIVGVVADLSTPTSVIGKAAAVVSAACPIVQGIQTTPVSPPANAAATPVVVSTAAAALKPGA
jgi:hypothetical protein